MDAFNDDEDDFFSKLDMDEIMAMSTAPESPPSKVTKTENVKLWGGSSNITTAASTNSSWTPSSKPTCGGSSSKSGNVGTTSGLESAVKADKKRFKFFKSAPKALQLNPPSPVPDLSIIEDNSEVMMLEMLPPRTPAPTTRPKTTNVQKNDFEMQMRSVSETPSRPPIINTVKKGLMLGSSLKKDVEAQKSVASKLMPIPPTPAAPPKFCFVVEEKGRDNEWREFVKECEANPKFRRPHFQAIPVTSLNIYLCRSILSRCKEASQLVLFGKMIYSFLEQLNEIDANETGMSSKDFNEMLKLLESTFVQLDQIMNNVTLMHTSGMDNERSQLKRFTDLVEHVLKGYAAGKLDGFVMKTRIPEYAVKYYPEGFNQILQTVVKTGYVELLIPACSMNQENFLFILKYFSSCGCNFEDDPDFQLSTSSLSPHKLTTRLLQSLVKIVGIDFIKVLPYPFQTLIAFEYSVASQDTRLFSNATIIQEIFNLLNDTLRLCDINSVEEPLMKLLISALEHTSRILNDQQLLKTVTFRQFPYLCRFLKQTFKRSLLSSAR